VPPNVNYIFYGTRGKALGQFGQIAPGKWLKIDHEGWNPEKLIEISRNESSVVLSKPLQNKDRVIWELDLQKKILREYYLAAGQPIVPLSRFFPLRVLDMLNTSTSTANLVNQLAQRFAPILNFDRAAEGYPMSAQTFYEKIDPVTGNFKINKLKKYSNTDRASLKNGSIPVYYQVRAVGPKAQVRIRYWWFFGYQEQCNAFGGGKHHGDWEGVMVTLKEDLSGVAAVTYWLHGDHYTRNVASKGICSPAGSGRCGGSRGFDAIVDGRPGVWVGKVGHGSYHDSNSRGPGGCGYWSEWRNPASQADRMDTQLNLVDLDGNSEPWMIGNETATFSWGPDGVGTHPKATNRNEQTGPPTASMRSCIGGATYSESSACYKSECLAGDNEEAGRCTKECLPGYTNMGLYCGKGLKTHAQGEYAYDYPLPTDDWGLVKRGQWWKTE